MFQFLFTFTSKGLTIPLLSRPTILGLLRCFVALSFKKLKGLLVSIGNVLMILSFGWDSMVQVVQFYFFSKQIF